MGKDYCARQLADAGLWRTYLYQYRLPLREEPSQCNYRTTEGLDGYENRNPVGSYVTFIDVTQEMLGKNLILHFGGVHSAMYVWINGQKVATARTQCRLRSLM